MTVGNTLKVGFEKRYTIAVFANYLYYLGIYLAGAFPTVRYKEHKRHQSIEVEKIFLIRLEGTAHYTCK